MSAPSPFGSLPVELLDHIFKNLQFEDKRNIRLVNTTWRNALTQNTFDNHFNPILSNSTIKYIYNINPNWKTINILNIQNLTITNFDYDKIPVFKGLAFGGGISRNNFWTILEQASLKKVEYLEFKNNSIPVSVPVKNLQPKNDLSSVTSLVLQATESQNQDENYAQFTGFINFVDGLNLPNLKTVSIELQYKIHVGNLGFSKLFEFLNRNKTIKSVTAKIQVDISEVPQRRDVSIDFNLEELNLFIDPDYIGCVRPLLGIQRKLKTLNIIQLKQDVMTGQVDPTRPIAALVSSNSSTLENLTLNLYRVDYSTVSLMNLPNCVHLKTLEFHSTRFGELPPDLVVSNLTCLILRRKAYYSGGGVSGVSQRSCLQHGESGDWTWIQQWVRICRNLKELQMENFNMLDSQLEKILNDSQLIKVVMKNVNPGGVGHGLINYCKNRLGIEFEFLHSGGTNSKKKDFCISIDRFLF